MAKILLVEDDPSISNNVKEWLAAEHTVEAVNSGREAADLLKFYKYDLVVLDLNLPDLGGLEVLRQYRTDGGAAAVIILTGKNSLGEKEEGLDAGADDYLTKPFHLRELSARIRAVLRRPAATMPNVIKVADLEVDLVNRFARRGGEKIHLFRKELLLLEFFLKHRGQVFSAEALLDRVWSSESDVSPESIRTYIARLRQRIDVPGKPSLIENVRGVGYRMPAGFQKEEKQEGAEHRGS